MLTRTYTRFHHIRVRFENHVPSSRFTAILWELFLFTFKQGWACLFGAILLALVLLTKLFWPPSLPLARYDFLFLAALSTQAALLLARMETVREAKVILVFHLTGTCMEIFKTHAGSWSYPEPSLLRIGQVPLFSGFMYASVGSYLARTHRIVDMHYTRYPRPILTFVLAGVVYANFFTHHFLPDVRIFLFVAVAALFGPTIVYFRPYRSWRRMSLLLGFALVALFIWIAENISTFAHIWTYPHQQQQWHLVHAGKYGAWFLLMILSFVLGTLANPPQPWEETRSASPKLKPHPRAAGV